MIRTLSMVLALASALSALQPGQAPPGGSGWFTSFAWDYCGIHQPPDLDGWTSWFTDSENYDLWGAHGAWGTGEYSGNANIVLAPTTAGVVVMCDTDYNSRTDAVIRVEEEFKLPNGQTIWVQIWNPGNISPQVAYGYRFKGHAVRRIRMSISNFEGGTFFWGGAY